MRNRIREFRIVSSRYSLRNGERMYILKTEHSFDSAHFLLGYDGKCSNIHGHRWRVEVEVMSDELKKDKQLRGIYVDFSKLKDDLREKVDYLDHALIIEAGSLKKTTYKALKDEQFRIIEFDFRPTAENLAKYLYEQMKESGYQVRKLTVYETPNNCASYTEV